MRAAKMLISFMVSVCAVSGAGAAETVRIGTVLDQAPFEYRDSNGQVAGLEVTLGNKMCEVMHVKCQWVTMDFDALIPALKAKKVDAVYAQMSITKEREKSVDFTNPITSAQVQYVAKVGSGITDDPATLKGKTVGVQSGSIQEDYMHKRLPDVSVKVYQTVNEAYLDLLANRIDAVFDDKSAEYDWITKEGKRAGFDYAGKPVVDNEILGPGTGIAVRKGDEHLLASFNSAIRQMVSDGTFSRESAKYFPFSIAPTK
ncbi:transporter substrate-binding domain-containing protein [Paraburkholderia sp. EG285A]|uniref:transporter substrate-binding domain-containing protein n=1 Tax=Paraburkholderia sp. EG285A TaxID=3237009 RepID=UPI0034D2A75F